MRRESELTRPPTETIVDTDGEWYLVWDEASGFEPETVAIQARTAGRAKRVWAELDRNRGADTLRVYADRLDRTR